MTSHCGINHITWIRCFLNFPSCLSSFPLRSVWLSTLSSLLLKGYCFPSHLSIMHYILTVLSLPSLSWFSICLLFLVFIFYHCLTFFTWPLNCLLLASLVIKVPRTLNHTKAEEWEVLVTQYVWMPVTISPPPNLIRRLLYCPFPSSTPLLNPVSQQSCPGTGGAPWLWSETCLPVSYSALCLLSYFSSKSPFSVFICIGISASDLLVSVVQSVVQSL